jgi:chromosome segregation ATPase
MAEILHGSSEHKTFAPLSHGQTLSVCQHLQALITQLQSQYNELRRDLKQTDDNVGALRAGLGNTNAAVHTNQENMQAMGAVIDGMKKDMGRTNVNVQKLQVGLEMTNENVAALREGAKVTNTNIQELRTANADNVRHIGLLREDVEKNVHGEISTLKDNLSKTNLALTNCRDDLEATKNKFNEFKEGLRKVDVQGVKDDLAKTNTVVAMLEQRIHEGQLNLKATRQNLEETNSVTLKIHEDHENTKAQLGDCMGGLKKCSAHVKQLHEGHENLFVKMSNTESKLESTVAGLGHQRQVLDQTNSNVRALRENYDMVNSTTRALQAHLEDTYALAQAVKAGLKETNSVVLPNLSMDNVSALSMGGNPQHIKFPETSVQGASPAKGKPYVSKGNGGKMSGRNNRIF